MEGGDLVGRQVFSIIMNPTARNIRLKMNYLGRGAYNPHPYPAVRVKTHPTGKSIAKAGGVL